MGSVWSTFREMYPPATKFTVDDIPDLAGKVMIITGGYSGVGKETAKALLTHNAKVYIAGRDQEKAEAAIKDLKDQTGSVAHFIKLDLANLKSIKVAVEEFQSKEKELHVLFNNGGVFHPPIDQVTAQGYDVQFGTNVLGHFYLTKLLLPTLLSTASSSLDGKARVISTSSYGHNLVSSLDFNTFKDTAARKKSKPANLYYQSKFGVVVFSNELARRYGEQGIISVSLNPGNSRSNLSRNLSPITRAFADKLIYPTPLGALTQLYAATSPDPAGLNGKYLIPWARIGAPKPETADPELGKSLWDWFEEQVENV